MIYINCCTIFHGIIKIYIRQIDEKIVYYFMAQITDTMSDLDRSYKYVSLSCVYTYITYK